MNPRRAFTLIELLVVVAVISILAAIALPNFLEAQTRAKVSRARADLRTIATALESYQVDWNVLPPTRGSIREVEPVHRFDGYGRPIFGPYQTISLRLSTPIAYLSSASLVDPFKRGGDDGTMMSFESGSPADLAYGYHNVYELAFVDMAGSWFPDDYSQDYGAWRLWSLGPSGRQPEFGKAHLGWAYDPTNGVVSLGAIIRTQLDPTGVRLIVPDP